MRAVRVPENIESRRDDCFRDRVEISKVSRHSRKAGILKK